MNIHKMIAELQAEKERLDEAIVALERLSTGTKAKRRPKRSPAAERPTEAPETEPLAAKSRSHSA